MISWRIDTFRICYASRIFFILCVCCALKVYLPFIVMRIVKIQDLQLLFITSDKAFIEILLGQKFFPNISSWLFFKRRICISFQLVCLTTLYFSFVVPRFLKAITWAYFANCLSDYQEPSCCLSEIFADRTVMLYCLGSFLGNRLSQLMFPLRLS